MYYLTRWAPERARRCDAEVVNYVRLVRGAVPHISFMGGLCLETMGNAVARLLHKRQN